MKKLLKVYERTNPNDHILRRNCLLRDAIEGQMTEIIGVGGRKIRRRRQLLDDFRNRRSYLGAIRESWRSKKMETTVYR